MQDLVIVWQDSNLTRLTWKYLTSTHLRYFCYCLKVFLLRTWPEQYENISVARAAHTSNTFYYSRQARPYHFLTILAKNLTRLTWNMKHLTHIQARPCCYLAGFFPDQTVIKNILFVCTCKALLLSDRVLAQNWPVWTWRYLTRYICRPCYHLAGFLQRIWLDQHENILLVDKQDLSFYDTPGLLIRIWWDRHDILPVYTPYVTIWQNSWQ